MKSHWIHWCHKNKLCRVLSSDQWRCNTNTLHPENYQILTSVSERSTTCTI